jgi:hypothetical protein
MQLTKTKVLLLCGPIVTGIALSGCGGLSTTYHFPPGKTNAAFRADLTDCEALANARVDIPEHPAPVAEPTNDIEAIGIVLEGVVRVLEVPVMFQEIDTHTRECMRSKGYTVEIDE